MLINTLSWLSLSYSLTTLWTGAIACIWEFFSRGQSSPETFLGGWDFSRARSASST
uniref:Uncharacterized protein n=1 Tax=Mus musculus TaxID=10090 RepID=Q3V0P2_MOUSE|nr:unnamed protein product [Mus musculus]